MIAPCSLREGADLKVFVVKKPISGTSRAIVESTDDAVVTTPEGMVKGALIPRSANAVPAQFLLHTVEK